MCTYREAAKGNVSNHHEFIKAPIKGVAMRIPYLGAQISKLGY
jgi:hypothetical protein